MANQKTFLQVNGVDVIEQQVATADLVGLNGSGTGLRPIKTVVELLLANDSVVYGCNYDMPSARNCEYTAAVVHSVIAHQRSHSAKTKARKAYVNRSAGAVKAAQTRRTRRAATGVTFATPVKEVKQVQEAGKKPTPTTTLDVAVVLSNLAGELRDVSHTLDRLVRNLPSEPVPAQPLVTAAELERLQKIAAQYAEITKFFQK